MKTDEKLRQEVVDALRHTKWREAARIGVVAEDGVVTLVGCVHSYVRKVQLAWLVWDTRGVRSVKNALVVIGDARARPAGSGQRLVGWPQRELTSVNRRLTHFAARLRQARRFVGVAAGNRPGVYPTGRVAALGAQRGG